MVDCSYGWLEIAKDDYGRQEMAMNSWRLLWMEVDGHEYGWLEMAMDGLRWLWMT